MRKTILIAVGAVVAIIAGVSFFLLSSLDSLVKSAIESVGSEVAGVPVRVSEVKISLTEGKGTLKGVTVGNPKGFKSDTAFKLGEVTLEFDLSSATQNPVVIRQVSVSSPEVTYEVSASGGSNIQIIQDHVRAAGGSQSAASGEGKSERKLVIDKLDITKGTVTLATPVPGSKVSGTLGDIHLTGIGRNGGASTAQVAEAILAALTRTAMNSATSLGGGTPLDKLKGTAGGITDKVPEGLKGLLGGGK